MRDKFPRPLPLALLRKYFGNLLGNEANGHGVGRHSPEERLEMFKGDLRTTSAILGNKKFILGDKPCLDDCAIFGQISQAVWGLPDSPYEKYINGTTTHVPSITWDFIPQLQLISLLNF